MIQPRRFLAVSVVVLGPLALWMAWAQNPAPQQTAGSVPTFRASANLVLLDVVVRDKGKPVEGLGQPEFQVLEDGKPQTITVFEEHKATDVEGSA